MARKVPQWKPAEAQLLKSRTRIAGYIVESGLTIKSAAAKLEVTPKQLKAYLFQRPEKTINSFNRGSRSYRRLYRQSVNVIEKEVTEITGTREFRGKQVPVRTTFMKKFNTLSGPIKGINPLTKGEGSEEQQRSYNSYVQSIKRGNLSQNLASSLKWQEYTTGKELPTSIEEIRELYAEREISKRQVRSILRAWRDNYSNMTDEYYEDMVEQFAEYDDMDY